MLTATVTVSGLNPAEVANKILWMFERSRMREISFILRRGPFGKRFWKAGKGYVQGTYWIKKANGDYEQQREVAHEGR